MSASYARSRKRSGMRPLTLAEARELLRQFVRETGASLDLVLIGGLALEGYGLDPRPTRDLDAEVVGPLSELATFLQRHEFPADLGEDISPRSIIAMPPGYRERCSVLHEEPGLRVRLMAPLDFVIAKLRRGTDLDLQDARAVALRFHVSATQIHAATSAAIAASPKDTALFLFERTVDRFCRELP